MQQKAMASEHNTRRSVNFDLLKVMAMFSIIVIHYYSHYVFKVHPYFAVSTDYLTPPLVLNYIFSEIFYLFSHIAVNCYVLVTGYFMIDKSFKLSRLSLLWIKVFFYSVAIFLIFVYFGLEKWNVGSMNKVLFPITSQMYWFITNYVALLIFAPILNAFVRQTNRNQYIYVLIGMGAISITIYKFPLGDVYGGSYGLLWFVYLYLTAGYLKLHTRAKGRYGCKAIIAASITMIVHGLPALWLLVQHKNGLKSFGFHYNGLVFFFSLYFFLWIRGINMQSNKIAKRLSQITPYTLAVYLLSDNPMVRKILWQYCRTWNDNFSQVLFLPKMLFTCMVIFLTCIMIDYLRNKAFKWLRIEHGVKTCSDRIEQLIKRCVSNDSNVTMTS